jgi:hypothetical protein
MLIPYFFLILGIIIKLNNLIQTRIQLVRQKNLVNFLNFKFDFLKYFVPQVSTTKH